MAQRTIALSLVVLLLSGVSAHAQTAVQAPGASTPGPAAPRPQTAPRDGTAAAVPTGTARIRGRVVSAETGAPLRRSQVRLSGAPTAGTQMPFAQGATTDADGRYEFTGLPGARYTLTVSRVGYVSLQFGQQRPFEPGKPLTLADGEAADKIDFALPRGGVIAGRITDDTGEPIPGLRLQAQRYMYMPGGQRRLVSVSQGGPFGPVTDDLGQFRIYGLMPGSYVVSAMSQMNGTIVMTTTNGTTMASQRSQDNNDGFATTYFPGTANVDEAQAITVELGQEASAVFSLLSTHMSRISGIVRNSQGGPLAAGRVMVTLRTPLGSGGYTTSGMSNISPDGSFTIANVPPGEHFIDVRPAGGPPVAGSQSQTVEEEFASVPVSVSGQDISGLVITMGPGATVSGRLIFDGSSPRPQGPQPLRIFVSPADPNGQSSFMPMGNFQDNGTVDESGRFQLRGVNGQVLFRVGAQGWNLKSVTLNGVDITDTPFEAKPSTNVTGLEVVLTDRQTSLSGMVTNARGDAVKDFVVVVFPAALREGVLSIRFTRTIRPDQQGRYQTRGLPPGDYVAVAVQSLEQGGEWDPAFQQQAKSRGKTFRLSDGQLMTLDLALAQ